ncbi:MAG TPA: ABC transporter permease, partial [Actinomycetota bacterium]|nr:ABC transporter permease [Actinomycetota bacterium]
MNPRGLLGRGGALLLPVVLAFGVALLLLQLAGAPPLDAMRLLWDGSVGSAAKVSDTLAAWVPLALAAAGLVIT